MMTDASITPVQSIKPGEIFGQVAFWLELAMDSAAMVSISYVVLFVGMRAKSSKAAILTSFLVIVLTQGNIGSYTLINNVPFYLALFSENLLQNLPLHGTSPLLPSTR